MNKIKLYYLENKNKMNLIFLNILLSIICMFNRKIVYSIVLFSFFHITFYIQLLNLNFKKNILFIYLPLVFFDTFYILFFNFNLIYLMIFLIILCFKSYLIKYYNANISKDIIIFYDIIYILMKVIYIYLLIKIY